MKITDIQVNQLKSTSDPTTTHSSDGPVALLSECSPTRAWSASPRGLVDSESSARTLKE